MKNITFFLISFFLCSFRAYSQYTIRGTVRDANNKPIALATVKLKSVNDSSVVNHLSTNDLGDFSFLNIPKGKYSIVVSNLAYESEILSAQVLNTDIDLGVVALKITKNNALKEVVIVSRKDRINQVIDRLIVDVKGTPIGVSGSALDVLERLPGVEVSPDGNAITLNGKSQVGVMMNGKLTRIPVSSLLQILSSTNAKSIDKIELISNPPAQYDAEYTGGLINIVQSKNSANGSNGGILLGLGYGQKDKEKAGFNWNIRNNKINFYGDINYDRNANPRKFNYVSYADEKSELAAQTITDRSPVITGYTGRLGLDYEASKKLTIGVLVNGNLNYFKQNVNGQSHTYLPEESYLQLFNGEDSHRSLFTSNGNVNYKLDSTQVLNFDIDYLRFFSTAPNVYENTYYGSDNKIDSVNNFTTGKRTPVNVWAGKFDYSKKISKRIDLNLGSKFTYSDLRNTVLVQAIESGVYVDDRNLSNESTLNEHILAFYASLNWAIDYRTRVNLGTRYEHSSQDLSVVGENTSLNNAISQFFPTLFISRTAGKNTTLQFSYGKRVSRPTYTDLAPYISFLDPNTYYIGNINLKPSFSDNYSFNYIFKRYLATLEVSNEKNSIVQSQPVFQKQANQQILTSLNLDKLLTVSASLNLPVKLTNWWDLNSNFRISHISQLLQDVRNTDFYYVFKLSQDFDLSHDYTAQLYGAYNSAKIYGYSKIDGFQRVNLSLTRNFKKANSALQISFNDIFGRHYNFESINNSERYYKEYDSYEPRVVRLTFTHKLGNSALKKERKRETSSDEAKSRL